jgi:hypothetical protein
MNDQICNKIDCDAIKSILFIIFMVKSIRMNSRTEVKRMLEESGNSDLWNVPVYQYATILTRNVEKNDKMIKQFFKNAEGMREQYKHDLIVKNRVRIKQWINKEGVMLYLSI